MYHRRNSRAIKKYDRVPGHAETSYPVGVSVEAVGARRRSLAFSGPRVAATEYPPSPCVPGGCTASGREPPAPVLVPETCVAAQCRLRDPADTFPKARLNSPKIRDRDMTGTRFWDAK
jgi:hypothetical protein